mmetsp:Transcript_30321/g.50093  ORF Transcript_30321/g.50093 Transcript_30321/m.50093 type:complete len:136 (+) Transcript_30321:129-536(+)
MPNAPRKLIDYTQRGKSMTGGRSSNQQQRSSIRSIQPLFHNRQKLRSRSNESGSSNSVPQVLDIPYYSEISMNANFRFQNGPIDFMLKLPSCSTQARGHPSSNHNSREGFPKHTKNDSKKKSIIQSILSESSLKC